MSVRSSITALVAVALAALLSAPLAYAAESCDALYNASIKSIQAPHHVFTTITAGGRQPQTGEAIYAGGVEYLKLNGKWQRSPMSHQEMLQAAQDKLKTHSDSCSLVGEQTAAGQPVAVFKVLNHETNTTQLVRIFKSNDLMQGATVTLSSGSVVETRYDYANVQAPAGM